MPAPNLPRSGAEILISGQTSHIARAVDAARDGQLTPLVNDLGAAAAMIVPLSVLERFTAAYEHAEADCAALARAWATAAAWDEVADRNAGLGRILGFAPETLHACAGHIRQRIKGEAPEFCWDENCPGDRVPHDRAGWCLHGPVR